MTQAHKFEDRWCILLPKKLEDEEVKEELELEEE
jgi:hypothetical protein